MISKGQKIPSVQIKQVTAEGVADVDTAALFAGKKVVMFTLPGRVHARPARQKHLPGFTSRSSPSSPPRASTSSRACRSTTRS